MEIALIYRNISIIFLFVFIHELVVGQNLYINNYTQKEYASPEYTTSPQNWDIEQDSLGRLYIANTSGVMLFDGLTWSLISGTENYNMRSLSKGRDGIIYTGGRNELGFFKSDSMGKVIFESLTPLLINKDFEIGEIYSIRTLDESVYFKNKDGLIVFKDSLVTFYPIRTKNKDIIIYNDEIVNQDLFGNLLSFTNQGLDTLFSFGDQLSSGVVSLIDISGNEKLLFTRNSGVLKIRDNKLEPSKFQLNDLFPSLQITGVIQYQDLKLFCIATKEKGILFINYKGEIVKSLDTDQGLTSNTIYSLFRDKNGELWACLDIGFARIEYPSALSYFDYSNALNGIVNCVVEHENVLYVGTTSGLYILNDENQFHKTSIKSSVWDLKLIDGIIWVAATSGIYKIVDRKIKLIEDISARAIAPSGNKNKLWVGTSNGIGSIVNRHGSWSWLEKIKGIDHEIRTIAVESDSIIWGSFEKISRLVLNSELTQIIDTETITEENGFSEEFYVIESYSIRNKTYFGTGLGLFSYDTKEKKLVQDASFGDQFSNSINETWALAEDYDNDVWLYSNGQNGKLHFENDQVVSWDTLAFTRLNSTDVWRIVPIKEKQLIYFCTTDGLFRYDQKFSKNYEIAYSTLINKIEVDRDSVISYLAVEHSDKSGVPPLPFYLNDLRFSFTATSYNYDEKIHFSYFLEGYDDDWSAWETESFKDYTNLSHGDYIFRVKARNLYGVQARPAQYVFTILPPWYRTYWSYAIWFLLFICGLFVINQIQRKSLFKRQQARIKVQQIKLEREQQISDKLRKVDKLKDQFLANTSHELRTPLNGIIGLAESLRDGVSGDLPRKAVQDLDMITSSGRRLENLVNDILDFSKLRNNELSLQIKPIDIYTTAEVVIYISRPLIKYNEITITNEIPKDIPLVKADENRVQQILHNLIGNAIKFTETGTIKISAKEQEKNILVSIKDTGIGIKKDKLDKIFESFQQAEGSISRAYGGTGLGLSVTKQLVELHGGKISVESTPRKGSTFYFTLPKSDTIKSEKEKKDLIDSSDKKVTSININDDIEQILTRSDYNGEGIRILIVDDEPVNLKVLSNQLSMHGYYVELANSGEEAMTIIKENLAFDLIILDIMMPKMSGYEVCEKLRKMYSPNQLPIIMLTAKNQVTDLIEGFDVGANDYLTKPFSKDELTTRIKTHLRLHKINKATGKFVPGQFLKAIKREMITEVELGDHVEKKMTVLFTDLRNFTTISESMSPEDNFGLINAYNKRMGPIIREFKGFINQYQGDGIMAIFPQTADEALMASIKMNNELRKYNKVRKTTGKAPMKVGIGIHTGNLIMGITGDSERLDTTTISDSVNVASRLESLTKYYNVSILLSEDSLKSIPNPTEFNFRYMGIIKLKGKNKEISVFECIDGDEPALRALKLSNLQTFNEGIQFYFNKEFPKATVAFEEVLNENPKDLTAKLFMNNAANYITSGVADDWTGVESMETK